MCLGTQLTVWKKILERVRQTVHNDLHSTNAESKKMREAVADDEWRDAVFRGPVPGEAPSVHGRGLLRVNEDAGLRGCRTGGIPR